MAMRNPHSGEQFADDDATIAAALEDVSVPALVCSLVHMTGDASWIRERSLARLPSSSDYQCGLTAEEQADLRRRALPVIAAYRDAGCEPVALPDELLHEMMSFMACKPLEGRIVPMMFEDMHFSGADSRAVAWGDEVPADGEGGVARGRDRLWRVRHPRGDPSVAGGPAVHHRRQERRTRRYVVGEPLSGRARRRR